MMITSSGCKIVDDDDEPTSKLTIIPSTLPTLTATTTMIDIDLLGNDGRGDGSIGEGFENEQQQHNVDIIEDRQTEATLLMHQMVVMVGEVNNNQKDGTVDIGRHDTNAVNNSDRCHKSPKSSLLMPIITDADDLQYQHPQQQHHLGQHHHSDTPSSSSSSNNNNSGFNNDKQQQQNYVTETSSKLCSLLGNTTNLPYAVNVSSSSLKSTSSNYHHTQQQYQYQQHHQYHQQHHSITSSSSSLPSFSNNNNNNNNYHPLPSFFGRLRTSYDHTFSSIDTPSSPYLYRSNLNNNHLYQTQPRQQHQQIFSSSSSSSFTNMSLMNSSPLTPLSSGTGTGTCSIGMIGGSAFSSTIPFTSTSTLHYYGTYN